MIEYQKFKKANHSTGFQEIKVLENEPCKVSFLNQFQVQACQPEPQEFLKK